MAERRSRDKGLTTVEFPEWLRYRLLYNLLEETNRVSDAFAKEHGLPRRRKKKRITDD